MSLPPARYIFIPIVIVSMKIGNMEMRPGMCQRDNMQPKQSRAENSRRSRMCLQHSEKIQHRRRVSASAYLFNNMNSFFTLGTIMGTLTFIFGRFKWIYKLYKKKKKFSTRHSKLFLNGFWHCFKVLFCHIDLQPIRFLNPRLLIFLVKVESKKCFDSIKSVERGFHLLFVRLMLFEHGNKSPWMYTGL